MNRAHRLILALSLLLGACTTTPPREPVEPGKTAEPASTDQRSKDAYASPGTARQDSDANPTVVSLLDQARQQSASGDDSRAARTLESALRIEPRNARLWNQLARVRLQQGQYAQAANLAAKANTLAGADKRLKADNWDIIASARRQLGDSRGAREAAQQAQQLR